MLGRFSARINTKAPPEARLAPPPPLVVAAVPEAPVAAESAPAAAEVAEVAAAPSESEDTAIKIDGPKSVPAAPVAFSESAAGVLLGKQKLLDAKVRLHKKLLEELNLAALEKLPEEDLRREVHGMISDWVKSERLALNAQELGNFVAEVMDEMTGLGPLEPLL